MRQVISPKALEQHIQVCHRTLRKAFRGLYQGNLTEKEAMDLCLRTLHDGLKPWLRAQGLRLCRRLYDIAPPDNPPVAAGRHHPPPLHHAGRCRL